MKIKLSNLQDGENRFEETLAPEVLELGDVNLLLPISVNLTIEKHGGRIGMEVQASSRGEFLCDRCGDEFTRDIVGNCLVQFIQRDQPLPNELPGDELRSFRRGQDVLDIATEIRDALLLVFPQKKLCSEDCKGLCLKCGANLNYETCSCPSADPPDSEDD